MKYPTNQIEFDEMFKTEQDCIDYLTLVRWPNGFECPKCGSIRYCKKKAKEEMSVLIAQKKPRLTNVKKIFFT